MGVGLCGDCWRTRLTQSAAAELEGRVRNRVFGKRLPRAGGVSQAPCFPWLRWSAAAGIDDGCIVLCMRDWGPEPGVDCFPLLACRPNLYLVRHVYLEVFSTLTLPWRVSKILRGINSREGVGKALLCAGEPQASASRLSSGRQGGHAIDGNTCRDGKSIEGSWKRACANAMGDARGQARETAFRGASPHPTRRAAPRALSKASRNTGTANGSARSRGLHTGVAMAARAPSPHFHRQQASRKRDGAPLRAWRKPQATSPPRLATRWNSKGDAARCSCRGPFLGESSLVVLRAAWP